MLFSSYFTKYLNCMFLNDRWGCLREEFPYSPKILRGSFPLYLLKQTSNFSVAKFWRPTKRSTFHYHGKQRHAVHPTVVYFAYLNTLTFMSSPSCGKFCIPSVEHMARSTHCSLNVKANCLLLQWMALKHPLFVWKVLCLLKVLYDLGAWDGRPFT